MFQPKDSVVVSKLYTQGRHRNASIILILKMVESRNAQYMTLFKSSADRKQIEIISQRIFPINS